MKSSLGQLRKVLLDERAKKWIWLGISALLLLVFTGLSSEVTEASAGQPESIAAIDKFVSQFLFDLRAPLYSRVAIDLTAMGSGAVLTILVVVIATYSLFLKKYFLATQLIVAGIGSSLLTNYLKIYFERSRPDLSLRLVDVEGYSYPSGHSVAAAAIYFTLALILSSFVKKKREKAVVGLFFLIIILLVGVTRVYLGVHYFSDVSAGILVGISWSCLLGAIGSLINSRRKLNVIQ